MNNQLLCSVDLEFTGFDPSKDQILELGFVFFRMTESGAEIIEEWSQVFKPSIEVHPKILGLTGITLAELEAAPKFEEHREFIQEKLRDVVLVAHNPMMDIKFLESYGIKLSGQSIDTLELVQFLLPTHHSYNLENLMHYFGISHNEAHRALGDCRSTILVLERLMRIFQSFTPELQKEIQQLVSRGEFAWQPLLSLKLAPWNESGQDSLAYSFENLEPLVLSSSVVTIDSQVVYHEARAAMGLKNTNSLLVINDNQLVMKLWRAGLVHGLFSTQDVFNKKAFEKFKQQAQTNEELRFCLKVIVWLHTNWQTEVVLELNISFFGGQFKSYITGGQQDIKSDSVLCCDYRTLKFLRNYQNRELVICNLQDYEHFVSSSGPTYLSWNGLLYVLRTIYNPETDFGNEQAKESVIDALTSADLFFALVYLLLHRAYPHNLYIAMPQVSEEQPQVALRLQRAAENLQSKLQAVLEKSSSPELQQAAEFLGEYFIEKPKHIRWVSIDEQNPVFHDQPLDIAELAQKLLSQYQSVRFTETLTQRDLLFYLAGRLGLNTEQSDFPKDSINLAQIKLTTNQESLTEDEAAEHIKEANLPVVAILDQPTEVKSVYNSHFENLKKIGNLFAQGYSGGGNKMFRNFSIRKQSILLATADFIARQPNTLAVSTVIVSKPPTIDATHPYIAALLEHWTKQFPNLKSILQLAQLIGALKKLSNRPEIEVKVYGLSDNLELQQLMEH